MSGLVRDKLWEKCLKARRDGGLMQIWSTNTEQRFTVRTVGQTDRELAEFEGLWLVRKKAKAAHRPARSDERLPTDT